MGGTLSTTVRNAYKDDIYAHCETDRSYVENFAIELSAHISKFEGSGKSISQIHWEFAEKNGFTRIPPHEYTKFTPDNTNKKSVYVSAFSKDGQVHAKNHPIQIGYGVIAVGDGTIKQAKYGYNDVDEEGHTYK